MRQRFFIPTLAYAIVLMALSVRPIPDRLDPDWPGLDKAVHALLYAGLSLLAAADLKNASARHPAQRLVLGAFALTIAYGLLIEVIQYFVPHRSFEFADMLANAAGAAAALLPYYWYTAHSPAR